MAQNDVFASLANLSQRALTEAVYQLLTLLRHRALLRRTSANNLLGTTRAKGAVAASPSFRRGLTDSVRQIEHAEGKPLDSISDAKLLKYRKTLDDLLFQKARPGRMSERPSGQMVLRRLRSDYETRRSMDRDGAVPLVSKASSKGLESRVRSTSSESLTKRPSSYGVVVSNHAARASKASSTSLEAHDREVVAGASKKKTYLPAKAAKKRTVAPAVAKKKSTRLETSPPSATAGSFKRTVGSNKREMALSSLTESFQAKATGNVRSRKSLETDAITRVAKKSAAA